ncbi:MAG: hypothetical protein ACHQIK_04560, partial [Candidatus Acidiferrales bacterium]
SHRRRPANKLPPPDRFPSFFSLSHSFSPWQHRKPTATAHPSLYHIHRTPRNTPLYLVCTENRGVVRGMPIMVGKDEVSNAADFEP